MASNPVDAFERTFPRREWYAGLGRRTVFWAVLSGLLMALLLLEAGLLAGLLVDRGRLALILEPADAAEFQRVTGVELPGFDESLVAPPPEVAEPKVDPAPAPAPGPAHPQVPPEAVTPPGSGAEIPAPAPADPNAPMGAPPTTSGSTTGERVAAPNNGGNPLPGAPPAQQLPAAAATEVAPNGEPSPPLTPRFEDAGLLPTVWRARHTWWGQALAELYRSIPWLRHNISALVLLLATFALTWLLRVWAVAKLRNTCRTIALEVSTRLRRQLHRQSMRLATEDIDGRDMSEAIELFQTEIDRARASLFEWLYRGSRYPWELAFVTIAMLNVEVLLTLQWALLAVLAGVLISRSQEQAEWMRSLAVDRASRELRNLAHSLRSAKLTRGYGVDISEQTVFQERLNRYIDAVHVQNRVQDDPLWLRLVVSLVCVALAAFMMFVLGAKVLSGEIQASGAAVFLAAFGAAVVAVRQLRRLPKFRREVTLAVDKVWRYFDQLPSVSQAVGAKFLQPLSRTLHLVDVTYRLPGGRVLLDRVQLQLTAGRKYAIVSIDPLESLAFAHLLPRFIEPQAGRVLFDGEDIAWGTLESLRAETMLVTADPVFLPGTVLDNIRAGQAEVPLTLATEAAKEARAHNFLSRLPQGYETMLDGQETLLDAGQRLRLSLARALVRNPSVLIIVEPDEPLDEDTKQLLDDAYARISPNRTVFFLPSRLATLRRCDDIVMFRSGRVEAMGPHSLLVSESPLYRHWEYLNFHEFRHDTV